MARPLREARQPHGCPSTPWKPQHPMPDARRGLCDPVHGPAGLVSWD
jgi:hypothetical protein